MTHLMIRHKVKDYEAWKTAFDNFASVRKANGEKSYMIMRSEDDAENLHLFFEWDTQENAQKFLRSPELKQAMQKAGVAEAPEIRFLNEAGRGKL
ncbi:MAG: antibiotic biosynthesis monooxygenase [Candidatus Zixiibacteriota bacterium]